MPNIKSAMKRVKVSEKKSLANKSKRSELKSQVKKTKVAVSESAGDAESLYRKTQADLDRAAAKGYLHKKNVARKKSQMAKAMKQTGDA